MAGGSNGNGVDALHIDGNGENSIVLQAESKGFKLAATGLAAAAAASLLAIIAITLWADAAKAVFPLCALSLIVGGSLASAMMYGRLSDSRKELLRAVEENKRMTAQNSKLADTLLVTSSNAIGAALAMRVIGPSPVASLGERAPARSSAKGSTPPEQLSSEQRREGDPKASEEPVQTPARRGKNKTDTRKGKQ